jgi:hypothetical protein
MNVVVDTNVFVSSFFGGNPEKIMALWRRGQIILCLSRDIIDEYVEVLGRLGLQNEKELAALLRIFSEGFNVQFTAKTPKLTIIENDPDDNKFIECAVALAAEAVISGDKAVIGVGDYMGIKIFTPTEFLNFFEKRQEDTL